MGDLATAQSAGQEALDIAVRIGARHEQAEALRLMAHLALRQGEYARARNLAEESLMFHAAMSDPGGVAEVLEELALVLSVVDDHPQAVILRGTAEALRERLGMRIRPSQKTQCAEGTARSRAAQGEATHERLWAEGRGADWREAVKPSLGEGSITQ